MNKILGILRRIGNIGSFMLTCLIAFAILVCVLKGLEPLAPLFTIVAVGALTLCTLQRRETAMLSLGGIALFILCWPALAQWGAVASLSIWTMGILSWFYAIYRSIDPVFVTASRIRTM